MKVLVFFMLAIFPLNFVYAKGTAKVKVNGMVCSMCSQGIEKKLGSKEEVKKVHVDLDSKVVQIEFNGDKNLSDETITQIITEAGYNVSKIERE